MAIHEGLSSISRVDEAVNRLHELSRHKDKLFPVLNLEEINGRLREIDSVLEELERVSGQFKYGEDMGGWAYPVFPVSGHVRAEAKKVGMLDMLYQVEDIVVKQTGHLLARDQDGSLLATESLDQNLALCFTAVDTVGFEFVSGLGKLEGKENPGWLFLKLYSMGAVDVEKCLVDGERRYVVDFFLRFESGEVVDACHVEGEGEITHIHGLNEPCDMGSRFNDEREGERHLQRLEVALPLEMEAEGWIA